MAVLPTRRHSRSALDPPPLQQSNPHLLTPSLARCANGVLSCPLHVGSSGNPWNDVARTGLALMKCLKRAELAAGESLFHQGEEAHGLFVLVHGSISLYSMHSRQGEEIGDHLPILRHGKTPGSPTDTGNARQPHGHLKAMHQVRSFATKMEVLEEPGALVGSPHLADSLLSASSPTSLGSPRGFCNGCTATANVDSKLFHLSKEDYLRCVQDNPTRLMQEKLEMMETIPLFCKARSTLSKQILESIASAMSMQSFPAHTTIASQGDEARLCILIRGLC